MEQKVLEIGVTLTDKKVLEEQTEEPISQFLNRDRLLFTCMVR